MPQNTKMTGVQTQTQVQVQKLSAQQIMVVKLLELPTVEFEERIHDELIDNPALEEGREVSTDEHEEEQDGERGASQMEGVVHQRRRKENVAQQDRDTHTH